MYTVKLSRQFEKSFRKIPKQYLKRFKSLLDRLEQDPFLLDIKKLQSVSKGSHRLRMGSYRIFIFIDTKSKVVEISEIRRRTTQTYH